MKILVSALEPSSNLHLREILKEGELEIEGIFDEEFGKPLYSFKEFSVMGVLDIIPKIYKAKVAIREMVQISKRCDRVLLIDAPAFNIPLAKEIKRVNPKIEIIYYILPKVWIWKKSRIKKVEKYCDILASIFPFEKQFYKKSIYVGNPLLDEIKSFKKGVTNNGIVAFLAGSRKSEIRALMPIFREVAKEIRERKILVIPKHFSKEEIKTLYGNIDEFEISHDTPKTLLIADFAFICSGTATLEASLIGTPFVLLYKAKKIDFLIAKIFVKNLKFVGLANIILNFANKNPLHKEFLQENVNRKNLLLEYRNIDRKLFFQKALELNKILKEGSSKRIFKILNNS